MDGVGGRSGEARDLFDMPHIKTQPSTPNTKP